jgi:hypothetical protein
MAWLTLHQGSNAMTDFKPVSRRRPAIIHFQPTGYRKVEGEAELKKLATDLRRFAGITVDTVGNAAIGNAYYETICGTGEYDDCSEEDPGEQLEF